MSGVEESRISLPLSPLEPLVSSVFPSGREKVSVGDDGWGSRMDAGDADAEVVVVAGLEGERVLVVAALRVREASTRASGRARGRGDDGGLAAAVALRQ